MIGRQYERYFKAIVSANMVHNYPANIKDITKYCVIFKPGRALIMGNTIWHNPDRVVIGYIKITREFLKIRKWIYITVDVVFVNTIHFLINIFWSVIFVTVGRTPTYTAAQISKYLTKVMKVYSRGEYSA